MIQTDYIESCLKLLEALERRSEAFPFRKVMQPTFRRLQLPSGNGWQAIKDHYKNIVEEDFLIKCHASLQELYQNSLLYGESAVMHCNCSVDLVDTIISKAKLQIRTQSPFAKNFPFPINSKQLTKIKSTKSDLIKIDEIDDFYVLIFCYPKAYTHKDQLPSGTVAKLKIPYDEVYGIKTIWVQSFDRVFINKLSGDVFFCIDKSTSNTLTYDETITKVEEYRIFFDDLVKPSKDAESIFGVFSNFFPLITQFYDTKEGHIVELHHITSTGSVKNEKMSRGQVKDLRSESFHYSGMKSIAGTSMFAIEKEFDSTFENQSIHINLPGKRIFMGEKNPSLFYAIVKYCSDKTDFFNLLDKLIK